MRLTVGYILTQFREVNWVKVAHSQSREQWEEPEGDNVCSYRVGGDATNSRGFFFKEVFLISVPTAGKADSCLVR